ncbi:DUF2924 domain-containing protein [Aquabacterium sp. A7-Y]|uniref:DUF2924 domain-containing protein n=1 Tax=Aquabacterium sp. A7-Y TaxID=1349605 RepID=UPI00223CB7D6|nr:DUF2924 domain-containing protein [Aquabacterium sp. A7-Y]MCW7540664.1 DUF2924 domain-containing protein [Aquabacterium sp. A7-Y]
MNERRSAASVAAQIASLSEMAMKDLWALWDDHFPKRPNHWNRDYVESRVAHRLQELAFGKLPEALESQLLKIGASDSKFNPKRGEVTLTPGTILTREYQEVEHRVMVTPEGQYELNGRRFKSLSAVARHITGVQWSGPAFFGLRAPRKGGKA